MKKTSIYLDEDLDLALAAKAAEEGISKAEFIRRNLEVVAQRKPRPRLAVGRGRTRPGYVPNPDGLRAELLDALNADDARIRREWAEDHPDE